MFSYFKNLLKFDDKRKKNEKNNFLKYICFSFFEVYWLLDLFVKFSELVTHHW